jgi:membrane protease subunit (stomatin/prohibitin family)
MEQLRNIIVARFSDAIAECAIPVLDLAAKYDELGVVIRNTIAPEFDAYGLELCQFFVENVSLPPEVEKAVDKRSSMGAIGDLNRFSQFQAAQAMEEAARNPGGMAAGGMGMGMGFAMANQMGQQLGGTQPPALPASAAMFYAAIGGAQAGPFDLATLGRKVQAGEISAATLVWKQGMAQWTPAGTVPELGGLFTAAPPPLPPHA